MKETKILNKYSLLALLILIALPLISLPYPKLFSSYFDAFDKISIPLWAALYSLFWIILDTKIKELERKILIVRDRVDSLNNVANKEYLGMLRKDEDTLAQLTYYHADAKAHFEFINTSLRATVIMAAIVKIFSLFFN